MVLLLPIRVCAEDANGPPAPVMPDDLSGNPLWRVPLERLLQTRARPPFAPTRRPPPPVEEPVSAPPTPVAAPEQPLTMILVGVVKGNGRPAVALLLDAGGQNTTRLKEGEQKDGWTLSAVRNREVVMKNGSRETVLRLVAHPPTTVGDN